MRVTETGSHAEKSEAPLPSPLAAYIEHILMEPFREDFAGREELDIYEILECARPYLPREGAFGEMVLNVGKVVYLANKGATGIIDISPFTCMNGIVCEAIYPRVNRDLGVYMELARGYAARRR